MATLIFQDIGERAPIQESLCDNTGKEYSLCQVQCSMCFTTAGIPGAFEWSLQERVDLYHS